MKKLISRLYIICKQVLYSKKKKCEFRGKVFFNANTVFEGRNLLADGANVKNSYMGYGSYLNENSHLNFCCIGRYSCVGPNVENIIGQHPVNQIVSIHPAFFSADTAIGYHYTNHTVFHEYSFVPGETYANTIGNDCWIGAGAKIMEGVTIGDGAVVAAGSLVVKDVPPYAIVRGIPAQIVKYRYEVDQIAKLLEIKWWEKDETWLKEHVELFHDINVFLDYMKKEK